MLFPRSIDLLHEYALHINHILSTRRVVYTPELMDRKHEEALDFDRWFEQDRELECTGDCGIHSSH